MADHPSCPVCGMGYVLGSPVHLIGCRGITDDARKPIVAEVEASLRQCGLTIDDALTIRPMGVPPLPAEPHTDPLDVYGCPECQRKVLGGVPHEAVCSLAGLDLGALRAVAEIQRPGMCANDEITDPGY